MQLTIEKITIFSIAVLIMFGSVSAVFAQDVSVETDTSVDVQVGVTPPRKIPPPGKPRPLQILHDTRMELKDRAKEQIGDVKDQKAEFRANMQMNMKVATTVPMRREIIQKKQDRLEEFRQEKKELKGTVKERLQALFRTHLGSAMVRLNTAVDHFHNFITRIESRIAKLKERNVDTTKAEASLVLAVQAVATAEADVNALGSLISSVTAESDSESVRQEIRAAFTKAVESVKKAHRALIATAKELAATVKPEIELKAEINSATSNTNNSAVE